MPLFYQVVRGKNFCVPWYLLVAVYPVENGKKKFSVWRLRQGAADWLFIPVGGV